ncbi:Short-chain dehydrogenase [Raineyella antarctica]|uniref:Short-chain dehydrogenase n=1 Tax=Raineyella antarctica TaxID=1577474 RepID=A0A1G6GFN2_9ACTN|nr:oxidoreductase [Raineyella antarctica]SDB80797.1 Short-chain dehydrogenase [Raineyella antarctica]
MVAPVAIVTGGSSGIGELTARQLHAKGYQVYAVARRTDRLAGLAESGVHVHAVDLTEDASMRELVDRVHAEQGRIDLLVNNAGFGAFGAVETVPLADARAQFEVNVFGLARMAQLVLPHMREVGRGRIINVSSIAGYVAEPYGGWYHASKHAVEGLSDCLRLELRPFGIDVVLVEPGPVRTEWNAIAAKSLADASRGTPYEKQARATRRALKSMNSSLLSVPASRVSDVIVEAALDDDPRARYPVGRRAAAIIMLAKYLPTRAVDALTGLLYHSR